MEPTRRRRVWTVGLVSLGALAAVAAAYFLGMREGAQRAEAAQADAQEARASLAAAEERHDARVAELEARLDDCARGATLLEANVSLCNAVAHIDDRNFGLAEEARKDAAARLEDVAPLPGKWSDIRDRLGGLQIRVAEDLQGQRETLRALLVAMRESGEPPTPPAP